jgi:sialic acid synthase SpsE
MSQIILDVGSGNTLPDTETAVRMVDEITKYDHGKHDVILKAQLFEKAEPNTPLDHHVFQVLRGYAATFGYKVTSSVFDKPSLRFLLTQDCPEMPLPFVKIACRPDLYWLIGEVPRRIPVYASYLGGEYDDFHGDTVKMYCVPEYPALAEDYAVGYDIRKVSDHSVGWDVWNDREWYVYEKHICLERDPKNPDSGPFAILPKDLEEIL